MGDTEAQLFHGSAVDNMNPTIALVNHALENELIDAGAYLSSHWAAVLWNIADSAFRVNLKSKHVLFYSLHKMLVEGLVTERHMLRAIIRAARPLDHDSFRRELSTLR